MDNQSSFVFVIMLILAIIAIVLSSISLTRTTSGLTSNQLTLLENLENNTNITSSGCISAKCFTDDYVKALANASSSFFSTSEGNVTCQSLDAQDVKTGSVDTSGILTIGDTNATAVNIGQSSITTTVLGDLVSIVPYGSIYASSIQSETLSTTFVPIVFFNSTFGNLVQFGGESVLQYQGTRTRRFSISFNISYSMPFETGEVLLFVTGINGVASTNGIVKQVITSESGNFNTFGSDIIVLNPLDTVQIMGKCTISISIIIGGFFVIYAID
jgi:hypothetical protein